jgi:cellulose synthase/poly-beta-1,6-N-acetylglucosamine synthase-like glycosyltransferase
MFALEVLFWLSAALVAYTYFVYPAGVALLARLRGRPVRRQDGFQRSFSFLMAARNEAARIETRLRELLSLIDSSGAAGEVILVADGCTDATAETARNIADPRIHILVQPQGLGKASALGLAAAEARHDILLLADVRQRWNADAVKMLLENFADPEVGGVSGELMIESAPGVLAGVGLYWRFEKWLRKQESAVHSTVGVTGAIAAVRRDLFQPPPPGTILDDVYWPLVVTMRGRRVVFDGRALAYDRLPDRTHDEFRRKVRTLAGNYQLLTRLPSAVLPWRCPIWFQFISHKLLRLAVPWALLALLVASAVLAGPLYFTLFAVQLAGYAIALLGLAPAIGRRVKPASAGASFVVLNAAAWLAFWVWIAGRAGRSWGQVNYSAPPPAPVEST